MSDIFRVSPATFYGATASLPGRAGLVPVPPAGSDTQYLQGDGTWGTGLPLDVKLSVRATTTANITLSGAQTIDGVAVVAGNRVLVKDQTLGQNNGIYVAAAGAWARSADANTSVGVTTGMFTFVSEGTVGAGNGYVLTTPDPIVLGTTVLTFTQFSGAGEIVAGNNITKTGNTVATTTALTLLNSVTSTAGTALTLATGTSGTFLTGASAGAVTLAAQGSNQSITLTPSGTGVVTNSSMFNAQSVAFPGFPSGTGLLFGFDSGSGGRAFLTSYTGGNTGKPMFFDATTHAFGIVGTTKVTIAGTTGNLLLGGLTTDGTGVLQFPAATTSAGGITMGTDLTLFRSGTGTLAFGSVAAGTSKLVFVESASTSGTPFIQAATGAFDFQTNGTIRLQSGGATALTLDSSQTALFAKKISSYNGITTAGWGVGAIQAATEVTAQSAAGTIATYTNGAADGTYRVSAQVNVTAVTALSTTVTCTYTDKSNTSRVMIFPVQQLTGSFIAGGLITGTGAWETPVMHIRCKASTPITIATSAGTFTGVTFSADAVIEQIA